MSRYGRGQTNARFINGMDERCLNLNGFERERGAEPGAGENIPWNY